MYRKPPFELQKPVSLQEFYGFPNHQNSSPCHEVWDFVRPLHKAFPGSFYRYQKRLYHLFLEVYPVVEVVFESIYIRTFSLKRHFWVCQVLKPPRPIHHNAIFYRWTCEIHCRLLHSILIQKRSICCWLL
ncbi:hypothetical protein D3C85_1332990 [compost metagenome]